MSADFAVSYHGSVCLLQPLSEDAATWIHEHIPADAMRHGTSVAVESRYIDPILGGIDDDGLTVEGVRQ